MFFKRNRKNQPVGPEEAVLAGAAQNGSAEQAAEAAAPSNVIPFAADESSESKTAPPAVKDVSLIAGDGTYGLFGQDAALDALKLALRVNKPGFNVAVIGEPGTGRSRAIAGAIARYAPTRTHHDWIYFAACDGGRRLEPIEVPHGRGAVFLRSLARTLRTADSTLEAIFGTAEFDTTRRIVEEDFRHERMAALDQLRRRAEAQNIAMLKTPDGYVLAPMHDGKVVRPEIFQALPQTLQRDVETKIETLERELKRHLEGVPRAEAGRRSKMRELTASIVANAVRGAFEDLKQECEDHPGLLRHIRKIEQDVCDRFAEFVDGTVKQAAVQKEERYVAGIASTADFAANEERIVPLEAGSAATLCGSLTTDAAGIAHFVAGDLHKANGGIAVVDLGSLLDSETALAALQRTLTGRSITPVASGTDQAAGIPFTGKVVLLATDAEYQKLRERHAALARLFPVEARFLASTKRTPESELAFKSVATALAQRHGCRPVHDEAMMALLRDAASRAAGDGRLSLVNGDLEWLLVEADHYAGEAKHDKILAGDVARALKRRREATAPASIP